MKFIKVRTIAADGHPGEFYWVRPKVIEGVAAVMIEGATLGPTGDPIPVRKAGISIGGRMIAIDMTPEAAVKMLELDKSL